MDVFLWVYKLEISDKVWQTNLYFRGWYQPISDTNISLGYPYKVFRKLIWDEATQNQNLLLTQYTNGKWKWAAHTERFFKHHYCAPKRFTMTTHSTIHTPMGVAAMQGAVYPRWERLGYGVSPRDTTANKREEVRPVVYWATRSMFWATVPQIFTLGTSCMTKIKNKHKATNFSLFCECFRLR